MKALLTLLMLICFINIGCKNINTIDQKVRLIMKEAETGNLRFAPDDGPWTRKEVNGWEMTNEKGKSFARWQLIDHAEHIIALGKEAVPELLNWLSNDNMHVRYISHYALEEITGIDAQIPHFQTKQELIESGIIDKAKTIWIDWYEKNK